MRNYQKVLAVIALSGLCFAQAAQKTADTTAKPVKKAHVAKSMKAKPVAAKKDKTADQLRELKEQFNQTQSSMQAMQQQLQQAQQQLQQTQQQLKASQMTAQKASACCEDSKATSLQVQKVQADLSDVKAAVAADTAAVQKVVKRVDYLENPNTIAYKGVRITPGGQIDVTEFWRQRAALDDLATTQSSIALESQVNAGYNSHLTESGITTRNSRFAVRFEGDPSSKVNLVSVWEFDMTALGTTANNNQTTSVSPRLRQAWGRAKWSNGWRITGGQPWNLITMNRKGTDADTYFWENSIDQATQVGPDYIRTGEVRFAKSFAKGFDFALALVNPAVIQSSVVDPSTTVEGVATNGAGYLGNSYVSACAPTATTTLSGTTYTTTVTNGCSFANPYSTNLAPDMVAKLAYDNKTFGHYEVKGLFREFRDRIAPTLTAAGANYTAYGWGIGGGAFVPVIKGNKMNAFVSGLYGKGVGRYQNGQGLDFIVRTATDDKIQPEKAGSVIAGFESHPTKRSEVDFTLGSEYYYRNLYHTSTGVLEGYGVPSGTAATSNIGCYYENFSAFKAANPGTTATTLPSCTGNNRGVYSLKLTAYYDVYTGRFGTLRYGAEYNNAMRTTWSSNAGLTMVGLTDPIFAGKTGVAPKGEDTIIMTVIRFILP
jgi:hypothetical protein